MSEESAIQLWREKLQHFQKLESIETDAAKKFALKKQIEEAEAKIKLLNQHDGPSENEDSPQSSPPPDIALPTS